MARAQNSPRGLFAKNRIDISEQQLTANSTGLIFGAPVSSLPGNVDGGVQIGMLSNSTGVALVVNTSGTTWKYLNVTSQQPT